MDLESIILSKSDRKRQILYGILYIWNVKMIPMSLIYKMEINSHTEKTNVYLSKWKGWDFGLGI